MNSLQNTIFDESLISISDEDNDNNDNKHEDDDVIILNWINYYYNYANPNVQMYLAIHLKLTRMPKSILKITILK